MIDPKLFRHNRVTCPVTMTDAPAIHKFFVYQFSGSPPPLNRAHGNCNVPEMCFHQLSTRDKEMALQLLEQFQVSRVYTMMKGTTTLRNRWQLTYLKRQMTIKACTNLGTGYHVQDELSVQFYAIIRMIDKGMINEMFKVQVNTGNDIETAVFIICTPICKMISKMMQSVDQFMPVVALDAVRNLA